MRRGGGLLSVALSLPAPSPGRAVGVTHHRALRSPDFPPRDDPDAPIARRPSPGAAIRPPRTASILRRSSAQGQSPAVAMSDLDRNVRWLASIEMSGGWLWFASEPRSWGRSDGLRLCRRDGSRTVVRKRTTATRRDSSPISAAVLPLRVGSRRIDTILRNRRGTVARPVDPIPPPRRSPSLTAERVGPDATDMPTAFRPPSPTAERCVPSLASRPPFGPETSATNQPHDSHAESNPF